MKNNNKPIILGGLKEGTRSPRDFQQGYRVYSSEGIANALLRKLNSDLYLVDDERKNDS